MPLVIDITKCRRLGEHRGRTWYDWPEQRLELEERGELLDPAREVVPDGPPRRVRKDGDVLLQGLQPHLRGTFASRTSTVPKAPKPKTVSNRPSDALDTVQVFTGSGSPASPPWRIRGVEGVLAKLARRGVGVHLSADGSGLVVMGAGTYIEAVRAATSVLLPWLRNGVAPSCQVSKHKTPVPAITVATGGPDNIQYCGECQP